MVGVLEAGRDRQEVGPGGDGSSVRATGGDERHRQGRAQPHLAACVHDRSRRDGGEGPLGAPAALVDHRQVEHERHRDGRERHAERRVAIRREGPVQRRADIVDLATAGVQPTGRRTAFPLGLRPLEEVAVERGVAPCCRLKLAALDELARCVGPHRLEEPIARRRAAAELRRDHRFRNQVRQGVDDLRRAGLGDRGHRARRLEREAAGKDGQPTEHQALGRGE